MDDQELEQIIQSMIDAGESEESIAAVIQEYPSQAVSQQGLSPETTAIPIAQTALRTARPVLAAVAGKVADGALNKAVRTTGRIAGGLAGGAAGAAIGNIAGPLGAISTGSTGAYVGGSVGHTLGHKLNTPIRAVAGAVANAAGTNKPLPVRGAFGKFKPGPLPAGRRLFDAFSKAVPGLSTALTGVGSALLAKDFYDKAVSGGFKDYSPYIDDNKEVERISPTPPTTPDLNDLPDDLKAEIIRLLAERAK